MIEIFPLLAILLYLRPWQSNWWLQYFKFAPVACNLDIPNYLVASKIYIFPFACNLAVSMIKIFHRCPQPCCISTYGKVSGGLNASMVQNSPPLQSCCTPHFSKHVVASIIKTVHPLPAIFLYMHTLPKNW